MGHAKLTSMMEFRKPTTKQSGMSAPTVRSRSPCRGTPQKPQASGQLGEPTNMSKGVVGIGPTVLIPVAVDVEPQQQQPNEQPQQQLQQQQLSPQPPRAASLSPQPPRASIPGCGSLRPPGGSSQLPIGRPSSGSMNLPVGRPGLAASMNLPIAPTQVKKGGGSMHVPSVGPVCYSGSSSDIQLQCSAFNLPEKVGSNQLLTPEMTASNGNPVAARENSVLVPVYIESDSAPESPTHSAIHGGYLTQSAVAHRRQISPSRARSIEQLKLTTPPSARTRYSAGPILSNTRPPIGNPNLSQISGPPGPSRATVPRP